MPGNFSLRGGSLWRLATRHVWTESFRKWLEELRSNGYYQAGATSSVADVWCFKWDQSQLIYDLGYGLGFDSPGFYLFLTDKGSREPYTPIYVGIAGEESLSKRYYRRYGTKRPERSYRPPRQLQIVAQYGAEIRQNRPDWRVHRQELERTTMAAYHDRLNKAECFAKRTVEAPYYTFHPIPRDANSTDEEHKLRLETIEKGLIWIALREGFSLCNARVSVTEPNWATIG
jgi:hypothetical protein